MTDCTVNINYMTKHTKVKKRSMKEEALSLPFCLRYEKKKFGQHRNKKNKVSIFWTYNSTRRIVSSTYLQLRCGLFRLHCPSVRYRFILGALDEYLWTFTILLEILVENKLTNLSWCLDFFLCFLCFFSLPSEEGYEFIICTYIHYTYIIF